jgi:hypothetical protein
VEHGRIGGVTIDSLRRLCATLDIRFDVVPRWRGGELDRLLNERHNQLGELVTAYLIARGWQVFPEVSFSIAGERGVIDVLAWHAGTRTLLVVELKTEIVDPQELLATLGRKSRLAARVARDMGLSAMVVSTWLVISDTSTNRRRVERFGALLRARLPADGRSVTRWLLEPAGPIAGISFFSDFSHGGLNQKSASRRRVRRPRGALAERGSERRGSLEPSVAG